MLNKYLENKKLSLLLFICIAVIYALIYMTKNCYSAAMVLLVEEGVLTKSQTGTISAVFYLVYAPFQIVGGFAADKYSPYKLITIGLIGAACANALILCTNNYYVMMFIWALNGAVQFGVWPAVFKIVSSCLAPSHRDNAIFIISLASTLGLILSYLLAGAVSNWESNFTISAIVLFVLSVLWIITGRYFDGKMTNVETVCTPPSTANGALTDKSENFFNLTIKSGLIFVLPVIVLNSLFSLGVQSVTPSMITESYADISPSVASILTVIPIIVGVLGKFIIRFIYRKRIYNECITMAVALSVLVPIIAGIMLVGKASVWLIVSLISLVVMLSTGASLITVSYMPVRFIKIGRAATASGLINAMAALGIVVSNFVSPHIADKYGWTSVIIAWVIFAAVAVVFSIIAFFPWKKFINSSKKEQS